MKKKNKKINKSVKFQKEKNNVLTQSDNTENKSTTSSVATKKTSTFDIDKMSFNISKYYNEEVTSRILNGK